MAVDTQTYNICITRGETFSKVFQFDRNGSAWDLTGYTPEAEVRPEAGSATLTQDLAPTLSDAAAGEVTIALTKTETEALSAADLVWDFWLIDSGGARTGPYIEGEFYIKNGVTRP